MPISDPKVVTDYIRAKVEEGRLIKMVGTVGSISPEHPL